MIQKITILHIYFQIITELKIITVKEYYMIFKQLIINKLH